VSIVINKCKFFSTFFLILGQKHNNLQSTVQSNSTLHQLLLNHRDSKKINFATGISSIPPVASSDQIPFVVLQEDSSLKSLGELAAMAQNLQPSSPVVKTNIKTDTGENLQELAALAKKNTIWMAPISIKSTDQLNQLTLEQLAMLATRKFRYSQDSQLESSGSLQYPTNRGNDTGSPRQQERQISIPHSSHSYQQPQQQQTQQQQQSQPQQPQQQQPQQLTGIGCARVSVNDAFHNRPMKRTCIKVNHYSFNCFPFFLCLQQ